MKLLYITSVNFEDKNLLGVQKKIRSQIEAFKKNNIEAELINFSPNKNNIVNKINRRINPLSCNSYIDLKKNIDFKKYNILYIRYTLSDFIFIKLLKKAKQSNPKMKIILEIPTYPYAGEYKGSDQRPLLIKDMLFRNKLKKYVDKVVTFSRDKEIFGISTITINNGIDLNSIKLSKYNEFDENILNIIAVANVCFWHGYDKLIKGIGEFYKNSNEKKVVNFYIIGGGSEISKLKKLSKEYNVEKYIHFEGPKVGEELNYYFDNCHIGIDHLGLHRKNMTTLSSLKSKEYCAKGIPFVLAHKDEAFKNYKYTLEVKVDENATDIEQLFIFKNNICNNTIYKEEMREHSKAFDWQYIMKEVIDITQGRR